MRGLKELERRDLSDPLLALEALVLRMSLSENRCTVLRDMLERHASLEVHEGRAALTACKVVIANCSGLKT
ncbi:hypothetical protein [Rhizobium leguminosarum]